MLLFKEMWLKLSYWQGIPFPIRFKNNWQFKNILTFTRWSSPGRSIANASSASYLIILNLVECKIEKWKELKSCQNAFNLFESLKSYLASIISTASITTKQSSWFSKKKDLHSVYHHWAKLSISICFTSWKWEFQIHSDVA